MSTRIARLITALVRPAAGLFVAATLLAGCVGAGGGATPTLPAVSEAPQASTNAASSSSVSGFYLRATQTQALAPQYTFGWLPNMTIADGQYINGMIAIPTIYPGPLYEGLSQRQISAAGIDQIVAEARKDGLLDAKIDFSGEPMPGSVLSHIQIRIDGVTHDLTGPLPSGVVSESASSGTTAAYELFWSRITSLESWLGGELGESKPYTPASIAVLLTPPSDPAGPMTPTEKTWPLSSTFAAFGKAYGGVDYRCATVTGTDLATLLPVVQDSNQLTRFVDSTGAKKSLQVVALVPGDAGPCA
jgi:hypothetical protein